MNAPTCVWNPISREPADTAPRWRRRVNPTQYIISQGRDANNDAVDSLRMNLRQARRALTIRDEETRRLRSAVTHLEGALTQRERELRDTVLCLRGECPPRPQQEWLQEGSSTFRLRLQVHQLRRAVAAKQDHIDHLNRQPSLGFLREAREQADEYRVEAERLARALAAATSGIGYTLRRSSAVGNDHLALQTATNPGASANDYGNEDEEEEECGRRGECRATAANFAGYYHSPQVAAEREVQPPSYFRPVVTGTAGALPVALLPKYDANDSREAYCTESCAFPDSGKGPVSVYRGTGGDGQAQGGTLARISNTDIASHTADAYRHRGKIDERELTWGPSSVTQRPFSANALIGTDTRPALIAVGDHDVRILRGGARSARRAGSPQKSAGRASTRSRHQGSSRAGFYSQVSSGLYVENSRTSSMAASARLRSSARQSAAERREAWVLEEESCRLQIARARRARRLRLAAENIARYRAKRLLQLDACLARHSGGARALDSHPPIILSDGRQSPDRDAGVDGLNAGMEGEVNSDRRKIDGLPQQSKPRREIEAAIAAAVDGTSDTEVENHRLEKNRESPMDGIQQNSDWEMQQVEGQSQRHGPVVGADFSSITLPDDGGSGKGTDNPPRRPLGRPPLPPSRANRPNKPNISRCYGADTGNGIAGIDAVAGGNGESDGIVVGGYAPWNVAEGYDNCPEEAQSEVASIGDEQVAGELWIDEEGEEQFIARGWDGGGAGTRSRDPINPRLKSFEDYGGDGWIQHRNVMASRLENEAPREGTVTRRVRHSERVMGLSNRGVRDEDDVISNDWMRVQHSSAPRNTRHELHSRTARDGGVYSGGMTILSPIAPGSRPTPQDQEYDEIVGNLRYHGQDNHATNPCDIADSTSCAQQQQQRGGYESGAKHVSSPINTHHRKEDGREVTYRRDSFESPASRSDAVEEQHGVFDWDEIRDENQLVPEDNRLGDDSRGWGVGIEGNVAQGIGTDNRAYSAGGGGAATGGERRGQERGGREGGGWQEIEENLAPSVDKHSNDVDSYNSCWSLSDKEDETPDQDDAIRYRVDAHGDPEESCADEGVRLPHVALAQAEVERGGSSLGLESSERWKGDEGIVVPVPGYSPRATVGNEDASMAVSSPSDEESEVFAHASMTTHIMKATTSNETNARKTRPNEPFAKDDSDEWPINDPPSKASSASGRGHGIGREHPHQSRSNGRDSDSKQSMSPRAPRSAVSAAAVSAATADGGGRGTLVTERQTEQTTEQKQASSAQSADAVASDDTAAVAVAEGVKPSPVLHPTTAEDVARQDDGCSTSSVPSDREELLTHGGSVEPVPGVRVAGAGSQGDGRANAGEDERPVVSVASELTRSDNETSRRQESGQSGNPGVEPETEHRAVSPTSLSPIAINRGLPLSAVDQTPSNLDVRFVEAEHDAGASTAVRAASDGDAITDDDHDNSTARHYGGESSNDITGKYGNNIGGVFGAAVESTMSFPTMSTDTTDRSRAMVAYGTAGRGMESTSTYAISSDTGISVGGARSTASLGIKSALDRGTSSAAAGERSQSPLRNSFNLSDDVGKPLESVSPFQPTMSSDGGRGSREHVLAASLSVVGEEPPPGSDAHVVEGEGYAIELTPSPARVPSRSGVGYPVDDRPNLALVCDTPAPNVGPLSTAETTARSNSSSAVQEAMAGEKGDTTIELSLGDEALGQGSSSSNGSVLDVGGGGVDIADDDDGYF